MSRNAPFDPRRRGFVALALATGVAPGFVACAHRRGWQSDPFALGVASGCPRPDRIVLWTRLAPEANPAASETVGWELAADEGFREIVRSGSELTHAAIAHSVHVEVGGLSPARWYWYRFGAGEARSVVGRTRTAPAAGAIEPLAFAIASCQRFDDGHYAAWRHLADEAPDLVVFLGDYIYESAPRRNRVRTHSGSGPTLTLDDYRARYAQYKSDANLRRIHASAPWIVTWDDHEVENDYASDRSQGLAPDFLKRRAAAYQAWWEHMPLPPRMKPRDADLRVFDRYAWGALARFHVLDDRQYRDYHACPPPGRGGSTTVDLADCPELAREARTILGREQEGWLAEGLGARDVRWNLIAQQTLMAPFTWSKAGRHWTDGWAGYPGARDRLLDAIVARRAANPVVLSGDVHCNYICDLKRRVDDPASAAIASEFCGTSIASSGLAQERVAAALPLNPHIHYGRADQRGYIALRLDARGLDASLRVVSDVLDPNATIATVARFSVEDGKPGPQPG